MKIDANSRYVAMAVNPSGQPVALKTDSVTGYLLVSASIGSTAGTPTPLSVDENSRDVATAVNPSDEIVPLQTDTNGNLYTTTS
jgi:hypothetical protein